MFSKFGVGSAFTPRRLFGLSRYAVGRLRARTERGVVREPAMNSRSQMSTGSPKKFRTYPLPTSTQHMKISNKATALRELQRGQLAHVDKLRKMKPGIDMRSPKQYPHVQYNAKRMQVAVASSRRLPPPPSPALCPRSLPGAALTQTHRTPPAPDGGGAQSCDRAGE